MNVPTIRLREWSAVQPDAAAGVTLRGLRLNAGDRRLLDELQAHTSLRVRELRQGLGVETGAHVGVVRLSQVRIVILPKLDIAHLMRLIACACDFSDLAFDQAPCDYAISDQGLSDWLGLALLHAGERIWRGGLLRRYQPCQAELSTPRGRIDLRQAATQPRRSTLYCEFETLTTDHVLNRTLAAGLKFAAKLVDDPRLRRELARASVRFGQDFRLDAATLEQAQRALDRRAVLYRDAVRLLALLYRGSRLPDGGDAGPAPLSSFLVDMNRVFERFLTRWLRAHAPADIAVAGQESRSGTFTYLDNPNGWRQPVIRPDLVFKQNGKVIAAGDAKYKNRRDHPPTTAELYQLTAYGLAYPLPEPREVLLFHPLSTGEAERPTRLLFAPGAAAPVRIRLVGVPLAELVTGTQPAWWPLASTGERDEPAVTR